MCITGLKKTESPVDNFFPELEMDELYWFIGQKSNKETRENVYLITLVSRNPRQIVGHDVAYDKSPDRIQKIVDAAPNASVYFTDGYLGYIDVVYYPGKHTRNIHDKRDTYTVEGINADLRHYIPLLRRRSRCFARSIDTLSAVVDLFVDAFNRFGAAKFKYKQSFPRRSPPFSLIHFL